jgi:hypothetical protein
MKYTLAIAALLGALSVEEIQAITVFTTNGAVAYAAPASDDSGNSSESSSDSDGSSSDSESDSDSSSDNADAKKSGFVQLNDVGDKEWDGVDHSGEFFQPGQHEMLGGGGYERQTPKRFAADNDDIFMRSMIEQYALEQKTKEGYPSGKFWMDEAATRAAANEVLETNCKMNGVSKADWLKTYFGKAWGHFDVNRSGKVEVIKMPQLMRFLCSDQQMYLW